ncbi:MAG: PAS domain S-box protein [Gemmataceae bacterium]|nr:PAS domain S-box protein [Gemmataceae bacterium]
MADPLQQPNPDPDWRRILDAVNDCVWSATIAADGQWVYRYVSPAIERISGRPAQWFLPGRDRWLEAIHPDDRPRVDASDRAIPFALRDARDAEYRYRIVRPDGSVRWVRDIIRISSGPPIRLDGVLADITDQHVAELALRASEDRLRRIIDTNPDAILLVGADKRITLANPAAAKLFDKPRRELVGLLWEQLGVEQELIDPDSSVLRGQRYTIIRPDGTRARALLTMATLKGVGSEFAGFVAVFDDVTALSAATEELSRSNAQSRLLLDQMPAVIWTIDRDLRFTSSQGRGLRDLGLLPDEVVGLSLFQYLRTNDPQDPVLVAARQALEGHSVHFEVNHHGRVYSTHLDPLRDAHDLITGAVAVSIDVTQVRELETRLRLAGRLEALGQLAGGAAHDINNLLTALMGHIGRAVACTDDPAVRAPLAVAAQAAERAAEISYKLLGVARRAAIPGGACDMNAVTREVLALLAPAFGSDIQVVATLAAGPLIVGGDPGDIHQILINLCVNARDAMPAGGRLTVSTELCRDGSRVCLNVADTGIGMTPEVQARIFEPLFTTKEPGRGTGLGMPSVLAIVHNLGGTIECDTVPGQGTRFVVRLPLLPAPSLRPETAASPAPVGGGAILVADDEPLIRSFVTQALEESGYTVVEAVDGIDAIEKAEVFAGDIALAILDQSMPRQGGRETLRVLRQRRPDLKCLFATGVADSDLTGHVAEPGEVGVLSKPYRLADLLDAVRKAIQPSGTTRAPDG